MIEARDARTTVVLLFALVGAACEPLDRPPTSAEGLPDEAVVYLDADRVSTFHLEEGVVYRAVRSKTRRWNVHLIEIDTSRCELGYVVAKADRDGERAEVTAMARKTPPEVVAAINGDFFTPENAPLGVEVSRGELRGSRARPAFAWRPGYVPWVGSVDWTDDSIRVGEWTVSGAAPDEGMEIVAGFPQLLEAGQVIGDLEVGSRPDFAAQRHPRTAVGMNPEGGILWWVVVDDQGASEGMTLPELTGLLEALGVRDAINFDGGGSSVMVVRGEAVSQPAGPVGERAVVNALVLRKDPSYCDRNALTESSNR